MRTQSTDADVRRYDNDNWTRCPQCGTWMVPLKTYEISDDETPALEINVVSFFLFLFGSIEVALRRRKLARIKAEVLPRKPDADVCPKCLHTL